MWFLKTHLPVEGKLALITGASQGLGAELAAKLYARNCSVILVARRQSKLAEQIDIIKSKTTVKEGVFIDYLVADVSDYDACVDMWSKLATNGHDPDYFFSCVGGATCKLFSDLTKDELAKGVTTNYTSALHPIHAGVKQVLADASSTDVSSFKRRHIVLCSSVAAVFPMIGYGQYAPLKSAVMSLSLILRQELSNYNYRVSTVFPGNFASEGFEEEERTKPSITKKIEGSSVPIPVSQCADIVLNSLDRGFDVVYTDLIGWVLGCMSLGPYPRVLSVFQVILGLILSIVYPIIGWFIDYDIKTYFKSQDKKRK